MEQGKPVSSFWNVEQSKEKHVIQRNGVGQTTYLGCRLTLLLGRCKGIHLGGGRLFLFLSAAGSLLHSDSGRPSGILGLHLETLEERTSVQRTRQVRPRQVKKGKGIAYQRVSRTPFKPGKVITWLGQKGSI